MNKLPVSIVGALATGAFTLLRPADWSPATQRGFVITPGVVLGAGAAILLSKGARVPVEDGSTQEVTVKLPVPARAALAVGLGAATCGVCVLSLRFDEWLENQLVSRGTAHPRRWMAAGGALLYFVVDLADKPARERLDKS